MQTGEPSSSEVDAPGGSDDVPANTDDDASSPDGPQGASSDDDPSEPTLGNDDDVADDEPGNDVTDDEEEPTGEDSMPAAEPDDAPGEMIDVSEPEVASPGEPSPDDAAGEEPTDEPLDDPSAAMSCTELRDGGNDGVPDARIETVYDEAGRVLSTTQYSADGEMVRQNIYAYDEAGRVTKELERLHALGYYQETIALHEYDEFGNVTSYQTGSYFGEAPPTTSPPPIHDLVVTTYDEQGNFVKEEKDNGNDGVIDETRTLVHDGNVVYIELQYAGQDEPRQLTRSTYDENGFLVYQEQTDINGNLVQVQAFENDANGRPVVQSIYNVDRDGVAAEPIYVYHFTYDEDGNELSKVLDVYGDGTDDEARISSYDEWGNRVSYEIRDFDGVGNDYVYLDTYAEDGTLLWSYYAVEDDGVVLTSREDVYDNEGRPLSTTHVSFEASESYVITYVYEGQTVREEQDVGMNGSIDSVTITTLDEEGRTILTEIDRNGDGTFDLVTSYTFECTPLP